MSGEWLRVRPGNSRLILSLPHTGTTIPDAYASSYVSSWQALADTDWWVDRLYDFVEPLDVTLVRTELSRSVIDVNRDPEGVPLYPGMAATPLCPTVDFDGRPLYRPGREPDAAEIARRLERYHAPYHAALREQIGRLRAAHPQVVLFDGHSIRSRIPRLFAGTLPACNIGTNDGAAAAAALATALGAICAGGGFTHVIDGRFRGGAITRRHGAPMLGVHAVQLELACSAYMDEPDGPISPDNWPSPFDAGRAAAMSDVLRAVIRCCLTLDLTESP